MVLQIKNMPLLVLANVMFLLHIGKGSHFLVWIW